MAITATGQPSTTVSPGLKGREVPFESIPVIDLAPFLDGRGKAAAAEAIGRACREVGFFYVKNHGIPRAQVEAAFAAARCFFDLPLARKNDIHVSKSYPAQRGYIPIFAENTAPGVTADLKECFDLALELPPDDPDVIAGTPFHGPNVWPEGLPGFRDAAYGYYLEVRTLSRRIAGAVALGLGLREDHFADKLDRPIASLRLIHYPPQGGAIEEDTIGCGAHSDYGFLTVLAQDEVGGLQLRNGAGEWIAAPPIPGTFVINVSELLERWTNGLYKATLHRVINTSGRDRYSMPFFLDTNYDAVIACLATCQGPDHPPKYPPVVGGEYLFRRYDETFAYRRDLPR
jgi:isopenicillin N synthase-like dioxygenase